MNASLATATSFTAQVLDGDTSEEKLAGMQFFLESLQKDKKLQRVVSWVRKVYPHLFETGDDCPCQALKHNIEYVLEHGNPSDEMIGCLKTIAYALVWDENPFAT